MKQKGFTLLETLISISVIATVASLIVQVFFTTTRANIKTEVLKDVKQNGDVALDVMTRMIRNSLSVQGDCFVAGSPTLDIQNPDGNITEFMCIYDSANGITRIASVSATTGEIQYLTSSNVTLGGGINCNNGNSLGFSCTNTPNESDKITISFQLVQSGTPVSQFEKAETQFMTTVSSRN